MKQAQFITHKGAQILFIDLARKTPAELLEAIREAQAVIATQPPGSLLTLTDVEGSSYNREVADALKAYVAHNKPFVRAGAVVGLNDLKRVIFNFLNRVTGRSLKGFEQIDAAKEWLAKQ
ncbi:MAG: STAS/SEC14 domain-containing protein [Thermoanaerobaculia bacterium]